MDSVDVVDQVYWKARGYVNGAVDSVFRSNAYTPTKGSLSLCEFRYIDVPHYTSNGTLFVKNEDWIDWRINFGHWQEFGSPCLKFHSVGARVNWQAPEKIWMCIATFGRSSPSNSVSSVRSSTSKKCSRIQSIYSYTQLGSVFIIRPLHRDRRENLDGERNTFYEGDGVLRFLTHPGLLQRQKYTSGFSSCSGVRQMDDGTLRRSLFER
ncbi:uncharacterized protein C8R40DRAFT_312164 [Lentinula edodes]|uniref:uncharacterized protein n=1 Tax=Lentinula edodes TaxID=5353 RepID=UPI001E8D284A|nr:uncharacterized protein C8R40DRAFT_312164 [Lentinula edodes]KAH7874371.1 hypothetical protein C8R40DRAFT_312164 [Lentinula edodes]